MSLVRLVGCIPISISDVIVLLIKMIDKYPGSVGSEQNNNTWKGGLMEGRINELN